MPSIQIHELYLLTIDGECTKTGWNDSDNAHERAEEEREGERKERERECVHNLSESVSEHFLTELDEMNLSKPSNSESFPLSLSLLYFLYYRWIVSLVLLDCYCVETCHFTVNTDLSMYHWIQFEFFFVAKNIRIWVSSFNVSTLHSFLNILIVSMCLNSPSLEGRFSGTR